MKKYLIERIVLSLLFMLIVAGITSLFVTPKNNHAPTVAVAATPTAEFTENFARSHAIARLLNTSVEVTISANGCENDDNPGTIGVDPGGHYCYNWQGFDMPIPEYAYSEAGVNESWFVVAYMSDDEGKVDYYITTAAANESLNKGPAGFANYVTKYQYELLKESGIPEY